MLTHFTVVYLNVKVVLGIWGFGFHEVSNHLSHTEYILFSSKKCEATTCGFYTVSSSYIIVGVSFCATPLFQDSMYSVEFDSGAFVVKLRC